MIIKKLDYLVCNLKSLNYVAEEIKVGVGVLKRFISFDINNPNNGFIRKYIEIKDRILKFWYE